MKSNAQIIANCIRNSPNIAPRRKKANSVQKSPAKMANSFRLLKFSITAPNIFSTCANSKFKSQIASFLYVLMYIVFRDVTYYDL
jgi:hypothetical protein